MRGWVVGHGSADAGRGAARAGRGEGDGASCEKCAALSRRAFEARGASHTLQVHNVELVVDRRARLGLAAKHVGEIANDGE